MLQTESQRLALLRDFITDGFVYIEKHDEDEALKLLGMYAASKQQTVKVTRRSSGPLIRIDLCTIKEG